MRWAFFAFFLIASAVSARAEPTDQGQRATFRWLDKISGDVTDTDIDVGDSARYGSLQLNLSECRFPADNPSGDAFAWLSIQDMAQDAAPLFDGWMFASSPALNALDHPRYDVWLMRCTSS
ncbi:MAG: DUF2155 domain-containing protein [Pseudomonadota bacterium]